MKAIDFKRNDATFVAEPTTSSTLICLNHHFYHYQSYQRIKRKQDE
jgi:hypothetical protein